MTAGRRQISYPEFPKTQIPQLKQDSHANSEIESERVNAAPTRVSVVIPTRNRVEMLFRCIASLLFSTYSDIEVVVVDDASDTDLAPIIQERFPSVRLIRNSERRLLSFSRNAGAKKATGEYLFFLDDDNVVDKNAISELVDTLQKTRAAVVTPVIYRYKKPRSVWTSTINKGRYPGFYVLGLQAPVGLARTFSFHDAFMIRSEAFRECGGFDQAIFPIHFSELDLAYRLQLNGYQAVVNSRSKVWHDVGKAHMNVDSVRSFYTLRNRIILLKRYGEEGEFRKYVFGILPVLYGYYLIHHLRSIPEHRFRASFNLTRGVVSGLAFRKANVIPNRWKTRVVEGRTLVSHGWRARPPLVSVIVPTKNSHSTIEKTLESLERQTYPNIEIIVVDNHSSDNTVQIAKAHEKTRVYEAGNERSAQVNLGVRMSLGKFIYRADSDFYVEPRVVEEAVNACETNGFKVITVHNTSDASVSFWSAVRKLERDCYVDDTVNIAARFMEKDAFKTAGGFDESMIAAEDYDLHNRLLRKGYKIGRIQGKEIHLGEPKHLKDVVVKYIFYGKVVDDFVKVNPKESFRQLSPVRMAYIRHWKSFFRNPKLSLGFFVYQYVRYSAAFAGYLSAKT